MIFGLFFGLIFNMSLLESGCFTDSVKLSQHTVDIFVKYRLGICIITIILWFDIRLTMHLPSNNF